MLQDDSAEIQAAFDAEPEDLTILSSTMDNSPDPESENSSSVLYNVLSHGASTTMEQINSGGIKKRFDCRWCKASFTKKTSLRRHMNLHSGSRPFQCPFCEYNATRKDQLKTHIKTRHTRDSSKNFTFKCPLCSNLFQSQKRMTLHMRSHQWDNFPCDLCQIKFKSAHELVQHLKRRHPENGADPGNYPYVCNVCHRWCHSIEEYVDHIQTHPQKSDDVDLSPEKVDGHDFSMANGPSRAARMSILEQALSKGGSPSTRSRYPSESSTGSRVGQARPVSTMPRSSTSPNVHPSPSPRSSSSSLKSPLPCHSMLSTLLQGKAAGRSMSPVSSNNGPYIVRSVSLQDRDIIKHPQYPVRNISPMSNASSTRMPPNVVSPTISRDSRESLDTHSPQLSSSSSIIRPSTKMVESSTQDEVMRCEHCHIIFADSIMYAIHMGCHDWREPFRCNICSFQCADRYEFMSHITRGLHQR